MTTVTYNYAQKSFPMSEGPGLSLDLGSLGRQEEGLPYPMAWIRHHDRYERS